MLTRGQAGLKTLLLGIHCYFSGYLPNPPTSASGTTSDSEGQSSGITFTNTSLRVHNVLHKAR